MTDQEKLTVAAENYLKLEKKFKIATDCLWEIYNDMSTQIGTNARIYCALTDIEEFPDKIKGCFECFQEYRISPHVSDPGMCQLCYQYFQDEELMAN